MPSSNGSQRFTRMVEQNITHIKTYLIQQKQERYETIMEQQKSADARPTTSTILSVTTDKTTTTTSTKVNYASMMLQQFIKKNQHGRKQRCWKKQHGKKKQHSRKQRCWKKQHGKKKQHGRQKRERKRWRRLLLRLRFPSMIQHSKPMIHLPLAVRLRLRRAQALRSLKSQVVRALLRQHLLHCQ